MCLKDLRDEFISRLMGHVNIMITQRYLLGIKDKDIVDRGTQTSPLMNL